MQSAKASLVRNGVGPSAVTLPNNGPWPTVFAYLVERFPSIPEATWQQRFADGAVLDADGEPISVSQPFRGQAKVHYYRDLAYEVPVPFDAPILFQDDFLVIADKPHFLSVMPAGQYVQETLLVRLKRATGIDTLTPMHRIDRDTAGLVAFVVQPDLRGAYQSLFQSKAVQKTYEAIAPLNPSMQFPLRYVARMEESDNFMQMRIVDGEPNSETLVELLATDLTQGLGHFRLHPITGRKHQLRAHMNALGMPIVNDAIYPAHLPAAADDFSRPLQLLASTLGFVDPISGDHRAFASRRKLDLAIVDVP